MFKVNNKNTFFGVYKVDFEQVNVSWERGKLLKSTEFIWWHIY